MKDYTDRARRGDRDAMECLFDSTKIYTILLCRLLLQDENLVQLAVPRIYRTLWDQVLEGKIRTEEEFESAAARKSVTLCRTLMMRKNAKAFRIPPNRNFVQGVGEGELSQRGEVWERVTRSLPPLHRFLYVLHGLCGYTSSQLAQLFKTNAQTVNLALEAEPVLLKRSLASLSWKEGQELSMTVEELHQAWERQWVREEVPLSVENSVCGTITALCLPIQERRAKKRRRFVSVGAALAILLCLGAWGAASLASGEDSQEEVSSSSALSTSAEETASEESASESAVE